MRTDQEMHENQEWLVLKDRALAEAAEGITIADARLPDRPLIYVNDGFQRLTGYTADEVLGRNCKFLQGPEADSETIAEMRVAMNQGRDCTVEILNCHKNGFPFWNRLSISPVRDDTGTVTHFIGIQSDVTARREAEDALKLANRQMQRDLEDAAIIQQAWLPTNLPQVAGINFAWNFRPCQHLAGDGLNILRLDENHVGVYVLDVSGHGAPAALLSASLNRWLSPLPEESCLYEPAAGTATGFAPASPAVVAATLNRRFSLGPKFGKFFTILYGVLDVRTREFRYVTAGHPPPVKISASGIDICPLASGVIMGILPEFEFQEQSLRLDPGDRLLIYTDGASEAVDAADEELGEERMFAFAADSLNLPLAQSLETVVRKVEKWCPGNQPQDDITLVAIEVCRD